MCFQEKGDDLGRGKVDLKFEGVVLSDLICGVSDLFGRWLSFSRGPLGGVGGSFSWFVVGSFVAGGMFGLLARNFLR